MQIWRSYSADLCLLYPCPGEGPFLLDFLLCSQFTWWRGAHRQMPATEQAQLPHSFHADVFPGCFPWWEQLCLQLQGNSQFLHNSKVSQFHVGRKHLVPVSRRVVGTGGSRWELKLKGNRPGPARQGLSSRSFHGMSVRKGKFNEKPKTGLHARRCFSDLLTMRYDLKGIPVKHYTVSRRSLDERRQAKESPSQAEGKRSVRGQDQCWTT